MFDIITFGSATRDIMVRPKNLTSLKYGKDVKTGEGICFPLGSKIDVEEIQFNTGGGGTNTAATFALQGFKTAFYGMIGKDLSGQELLNELKTLKIDSRFVFKTDKKPTNHSIVILGGQHDRTILSYRGAAELLSEKDIHWNKLKTQWIYLAPLSGLLCLPRSESADSTIGATLFEAIVNFAHEHNIKIAVNPGIAQLYLMNFLQIAKKIDVLILNQEEASFLTKLPFEKEREIFAKIDEMSPGVVVMTKGGEGVVVSAASPSGEARLAPVKGRDGKTIYSAKPLENRKIVDTTGAGDAFGSGFISEFMRSSDIEKSIQLGMANSTGCISEIGAKNGLLKKGQEFEKVTVMRS